MRSLALTLALAGCRAVDDGAPPGFVPLFNGRDLGGWKAVYQEDPVKRAKMSPEERAEKARVAAERMLATWFVKDGVLHNIGKGVSIETEKEFGNFELLMDWKIDPRGDSGVFLRGYPQVQIWDSKEQPVGSGGLDTRDKAVPPTKCADKPAGEWNAFRIVIKGDKVSVRLNGELIVDDARLGNEWEPGKPLAEQGPIVLQVHGRGLYFKNLYIREFE